MIDESKSFDLHVETVFNAFEMLALSPHRGEFIKACAQKQYCLTASEELIALAKSFLNRLPQPKVPGPDCPACPAPRGN